MLALIVPAVLAVCDLGSHFARPEAWTESSVDFAVDHRADGFGFASQRRDVVTCMRQGGCTWHGLPVYEARVYFFATGCVSRVELSLYNRGDDPTGAGLDSTQLKTLLETVAGKTQPGGRIGSNISRTKLRNGTHRFSQRWTGGDCEVELAWGVSGTKARTQTADFVRVTLLPRKDRKAARRAAVQRQPVQGIVAKAKVRAHVKKNADGDVWIDAVPMVDQGQKGYCAAATSERVLRYYGYNIDEHEIAQAAGTTAHGGTSTSEMVETVRAVGSKCRLGFSSIISPAGSMRDLENEIQRYNKAAKAAGSPQLSKDAFLSGGVFNIGAMRQEMEPKIVKNARIKDPRYRKFLTGVKTQVDQGIPVFWGVTLGMFPEPGLPQTAGGHMRLIVGYNAKTHEIIYSDSWGAGHELKRMPEDWAFAITDNAFFLRPL